MEHRCGNTKASWICSKNTLFMELKAPERKKPFFVVIGSKEHCSGCGKYAHIFFGVCKSCSEKHFCNLEGQDAINMEELRRAILKFESLPGHICGDRCPNHPKPCASCGKLKTDKSRFCELCEYARYIEAREKHEYELAHEEDRRDGTVFGKFEYGTSS